MNTILPVNSTLEMVSVGLNTATISSQPLPEMPDNSLEWVTILCSDKINNCPGGFQYTTHQLPLQLIDILDEGPTESFLRAVHWKYPLPAPPLSSLGW